MQRKSLAAMLSFRKSCQEVRIALVTYGRSHASPIYQRISDLEPAKYRKAFRPLETLMIIRIPRSIVCDTSLSILEDLQSSFWHNACTSDGLGNVEILGRGPISRAIVQNILMIVVNIVCNRGLS